MLIDNDRNKRLSIYPSIRSFLHSFIQAPLNKIFQDFWTTQHKTRRDGDGLAKKNSMFMEFMLIKNSIRRFCQVSYRSS